MAKAKANALVVDPVGDDDEDVIASSKELDIVEYFGEKPLRWYQIAARTGTIQAITRKDKKIAKHRVLIVLPTGAGKTITIACSLNHPDMRKALNIRGKRKMRVLFAAHKHRLLTQAERTFAEDSGVELIPHSIFTDLPKEVIKEGWDVTVLDEAHHEACMSFQLLLEKLGIKVIIGLTATPDRADGCVIKFDTIINPISREQAVAEGYLAPTYLNSIVDAPSSDKIEVTKMVIDRFGTEFGQTMMFFKTKREVATISDYLNKKGFRSVPVLDMTERELDRTLDQFSEEKFQFIVNCNKINEGVDVKGCTDVYLGRSYGSYPQLNQVIGRSSRPDSDSNVWELINPLSGRNLDTTVVVGTPERHRLIFKVRGEWVERDFDYTSSQVGGPLEIAKDNIIIHHR